MSCASLSLIRGEPIDAQHLDKLFDRFYRLIRHVAIRRARPD